MLSFFSSPTLQPAHESGSSLSVLDLDDESAFISTLNPSASEFVPSFYHINDGSEEARMVDDILHTMHHLVSVYDSEQLMHAQQFAGDPDRPELPIDDATAYYLDQEEALCSGLHVPGQKPKGSTYGRKAARDGRPSRERRRRSSGK